jgi:hypothetical protein
MAGILLRTEIVKLTVQLLKIYLYFIIYCFGYFFKYTYNEFPWYHIFIIQWLLPLQSSNFIYILLLSLRNFLHAGPVKQKCHPKKNTSPLYLHLQQRIAGATININGEAAKRRSPKAAKNPKTCHNSN